MTLSIDSVFISARPSKTTVGQPLVQRLTREEKASLLAGVDDWHVRGIERLGLPGIRVTDCGHGVTLCGDRGSPATCFPTGIGMASTWNVSLMERVGIALGRETRALGCSMLLGPMINLHRVPLNGRSFETFSEDPVLAGRLGAAIIRGIQAAGVAACVKSVTANNQQKDQEKLSVQADGRTLRELYLRAFEIAVREGEPAAIMTAYNALNGDLTSESRWLLTDVVKGDWNFPGLIVSDWRAVKTPKVYASGLDLEMPGPGKFLNTRAVLAALDRGDMSEADLDDKASRILGVLQQYGMAEDAVDHDGALDTSEHRALALQVAEESIVLLKNENAILPLDRRGVRRVLVCGPNAAEARIGGGGSASVTPFYTVSPLAGIREVCGPEVDVQLIEGCGIVGTMEPIRGHVEHVDSAGRTQAGWHAEFFNHGKPVGAPDAAWGVPHVDYSWGWATPGVGVLRTNYAVRFTGRVTPITSGPYRIGAFGQEGTLRLFVNGRLVIDAWPDDATFEHAYVNRYETIELDLEAGKAVDMVFEYGKRAARGAVRLEWHSPDAVDPMERIAEEAREADVVIVCAGLSNLLEGGARDRVDMNLPPAQVRLIETAVAANPRTVVALFNGGPLAMPWEAKVPALLEAWYPGQEGGRALARILFGQVNPSGRLPDTLAHRFEDHAAAANYPGDGRTVHYAERLAVGYRHFDTAGVKPHYPFGYGLSYTTFRVGSPILSAEQIKAGAPLHVRVPLSNTGDRAGATVVQLYVRPLDATVERPLKELKAFAKHELGAGEAIEVRFTLGARDFAYYDVESSDWRVEPGRYEILVGENAGQTRGRVVTVIS